MHKLIGSTLLLAALFSAGAQADEDGLTLQQQREKIGDEMVQERTGTPPADVNGAGQSTTDPMQQQQQTPRSTLNSPVRQNGTGTGTERQPSTTAPNIGGGSTAPATPGTGGGSQGVGGAATQ
ncbi:hypothetical protein FB481_104236 [Pseudomonas sp. AG1028]|uniref:hypothetical protein n=1 Tax=Pseudomonas sp. AG1028 TaxID=2572911 RepID=UPI0011ABDF6B|nr:hypothetical protein [Pseudomonas sp. AG1028]TWE07150.1 hypothetical protein FB481_104236 [Pseudomonas sp. AG1028]